MSDKLPPPPNPYANRAADQPPLSPSDERTWSILTHVLSIFFGFIPALIFFILFRNRGPFVRYHAATQLNFQITLAIVYALSIASFLVTFVSSIVVDTTTRSSAAPSFLWIFLGYGLELAAGLLSTVFSIIAAVKANNGVFYRIPIAIPFVKTQLAV